MNSRTFLIIFTVFLLVAKSGLAKKDASANVWKEVIPNITRQLVPEDTQQTIEKIFPPQINKNTDSSISNKNKSIQNYYGEKILKGKLIDPVHIHGVGMLKSVTTKELIEIDKDATVQNSKIGRLIANRTLNVEDSTIQSLKVKKSASLKNSTILQVSTFYNDLIAERTDFNEPIYLKGTSITLKSVKCKDLNLSSSSSQTITLEDSKVSGKIVFEKRVGKIIIKGSTHIKGKIKNGTFTGG